MRTKIVTRVMVAAVVTGTASLVFLLPSVTASAKSASKSKGPVTVTCTNLFGSSTAQTLTGCTGSAGAKSTAVGLTIVASNLKSATIYWTDKKFSTVTFSYTLGVSDASCPTLNGQPPSEAASEAGTVTGGNAKLTTGTAEPGATVCLYAGGSNDKPDLVTDSLGSITF